MRKPLNSVKATSLDDAISLTKQYAKANRLPSKIMADFMGVELKTYYRWLLEGTLPMNRIAQLERLSGCHFISEYLVVMHGDRVVIDIPRGRKSKIADVARIQTQAAQTITLLSHFYENGEGVDETIEALTQILSMLAFQRENVKKTENQELMFEGDR